MKTETRFTSGLAVEHLQDSDWGHAAGHRLCDWKDNCFLLFPLISAWTSWLLLLQHQTGSNVSYCISVVCNHLFTNPKYKCRTETFPIITGSHIIWSGKYPATTTSAMFEIKGDVYI